jgi:hypothetical protein
MTIIAAISANWQGTEPLHLAAQIARSTGDKIVAAAVVERPWPPRGDPVEDEYLGYVTSSQEVTRADGRQAANRPRHLGCRAPINVRPNRFDGSCRGDRRRSGGGGSSSSGLLGRVALGSVTGRLGHTVSFRWPLPARLSDESRAHPAADGVVRGAGRRGGLVATSAELAKRWSLALRIVSFTVRPKTALRGTIEPSAENLVVEQWVRRIVEEITKQLNDVRSKIALPDIEVVIGSGHDWREEVEEVSWETGDLLLLGSERPDQPPRCSSARPPRRSCATLPSP